MDWKATWQKRSVRWSVYGTVLFVLYLLLAGLGLPALIQSQGPKWVDQNLAGKLSLGDVRFHPLHWILTVEQAELVDEQSELVAEVGRLTVDLDPWRSLFSWSGRTRYIGIEEPKLILRSYPEGDTNLNRLVAPLSANAEPAPEPSPEEESGMPALIFDDIALVNGGFEYHHNDQLDLAFGQLSITAEDLHLAGQGNQIKLALTGPGGGQVDIDAAATFAPLALQANLGLHNGDAVRFWPLLAHQFQFDLDSLKLDFDARIEAKQPAEGPLQLQLSDGLLVLRELAISHDKAEVLALEQLQVQEIEVGLIEQAVTIRSVDLQNGSLQAKLLEQGVDLAEIFTPVASEEEPQAEPEPANASDEAAAPWTVELSQFNLKAFTTTLQDATMAPEPVDWVLTVDSLELGPLGTDLSVPVLVDLDASINEQTELFVDGEAVIEPLSLALEIDLKEFLLKDTIPYWEEMIALDLSDGRFGTKGKVTLTEVEPLTAQYQGEISVSDLITKDKKAGRDFVKWKQLTVQALDVTTVPLALSIDTIDIVEPYARVIINEDGSTNLSELTATDEEGGEEEGGEAADKGDEPSAGQAESAPVEATASTEPAEAEASSEPMAIAINTIKLSDGGAFFADNTLTPRFATGIETLGGSITGLSSEQEQRAKVDIEGAVDRYAPMSLRGEIQPLAQKQFLDLALDFNNIDLTTLNTYSGTYAGYFVDQGQMDLALNYALDGTALKGNNKVVLDQLKLGQRSDSEQATDLPVALAIALMQDSNGVIDLDLAVEGDLEDPSFAIGPVIAEALGNMIAKLVTAPFALLGSLVGGEEPPNPEVSFAPGESTIGEDQKADMNRIVKAMEQRPQLSLSVIGAIDPATDSEALAAPILAQQLGFEEGFDLADLPRGGQKALIEAFEAQAGDGQAEVILDQAESEEVGNQRMYQALLDNIDVSNDALGDLAQARADQVKVVLTEEFGMAQSRVFVRESKVNLEKRGSKAVMSLEATQ